MICGSTSGCGLDKTVGMLSELAPLRWVGGSRDADEGSGSCRVDEGGKEESDTTEEGGEARGLDALELVVGVAAKTAMVARAVWAGGLW